MAKGHPDKPGIVARIRGGLGAGRGDNPNHRREADPEGQNTVAQELGFEGNKWTVAGSQQREVEDRGFPDPFSDRHKLDVRLDKAAADRLGSGNDNDPFYTPEQRKAREGIEGLMNSHHSAIQGLTPPELPF